MRHRLLSPGERRNVISVGAGNLPLPRLSNSVALPGLVRARSLRTLRRLPPPGAPHLRDCAGALDARSRVAAPSGTYLPWTTCPRRGRWRGSNSSVGSGLPHTPTLSCKSGTPRDRPRQASLRDSASALACARPHLEVVVLHCQEPACHPGGWYLWPFQGGVVCD